MQEKLIYELSKNWENQRFISPIGVPGNIEGFSVDGDKMNPRVISTLATQYINTLHKSRIPVMLEVGFGNNPNPLTNYGYLGVTANTYAGLPSAMPDGNLPIMAFFKGTDITNLKTPPVDFIFSNRPFPNSGGNDSYNFDVQFVHETRLIRRGGFIVVLGRASTFHEHYSNALEKFSNNISKYENKPTTGGTLRGAKFRNGDSAIFGPLNLLRGQFPHLEILQKDTNSAHETGIDPLALIYKKA